MITDLENNHFSVSYLIGNIQIFFLPVVDKMVGQKKKKKKKNNFKFQICSCNPHCSLHLQSCWIFPRGNFCKLEHQFPYYIHFQTNTLEKGMK